MLANVQIYRANISLILQGIHELWRKINIVSFLFHSAQIARVFESRGKISLSLKSNVTHLTKVLTITRPDIWTFQANFKGFPLFSLNEEYSFHF